LDTEVGEGGGKLSGGQRQRLGIARALITNPLLLVLDEATSSLDGETEETVTSTLNALKGKITTILIAHRLSTVMNADKIIYIADGRVQASGNFSEVRSMIPDFNNQAKLLGL
jgi:ABC-type bacteriocin/lantibiotic exporter with double-glycine peptidase domain